MRLKIISSYFYVDPVMHRTVNMVFSSEKSARTYYTKEKSPLSRIWIGFLLLIVFSLIIVHPVYAADENAVPSEVLSPVIGELGITNCCDTQCPIEKRIAGKWEYCQHQSGKENVCEENKEGKISSVKYSLGHVENGGVGYASDTYAWDINFRTSANPDMDAGEPVYAVATGVVADHFGQIRSCPYITAEGGIRTCENEETMPFANAQNAGGQMGQVLIDHGGWYSGYVHLTKIAVKPGDNVTESTLLGYISSTGLTGVDKNNHLHFAVYSGSNTACGLKSVNVKIIERSDSAEEKIPDQEIRVTGDSDNPGNAEIFGNYIFWRDRITSEYYVYDIITGETRSISHGKNIFRPAHDSGNYIVWHEQTENRPDGIYLYDIRKNTETRISESYPDNGRNALDVNLRVSSKYVVWLEFSSHSRYDNIELFLYDISTRQERKIITRVPTDSELDKLSFRHLSVDSLEITDNYIVWEEETNDPLAKTDTTNYSLYVYDIQSGKEKCIGSTEKYKEISENLLQSFDFSNIHAGENTIIWQDGPGNYRDIFLYDIPSGSTKKISDKKGLAMYEGVHISDNNIVWRSEDPETGKSAISVYDIMAGTQRKIPLDRVPLFLQIDENNLVWMEQDHQNRRHDIFTYNLVSGKTRKITTNEKSSPVNGPETLAISDKTVIWVDSRNSGVANQDKTDIYLTQITDNKNEQSTSPSLMNIENDLPLYKKIIEDLVSLWHRILP